MSCPTQTASHTSQAGGSSGLPDIQAELLPRQEYLRLLSPAVIPPLQWELPELHYQAVRAALLGGQEIAPEVLQDYPDRVAELRPWTLDGPTWAGLEAERRNRPTIYRIHWKWEQPTGEKQDFTPSLDEALAQLNRARLRFPDWRFELEAVPSGQGQVEYGIVLLMNKEVKPEDRCRPDEVIHLHRGLVEDALRSGEPVPTGVLIAYPDLLARFGL